MKRDNNNDDGCYWLVIVLIGMLFVVLTMFNLFGCAGVNSGRGSTVEQAVAKINADIDAAAIRESSEQSATQDGLVNLAVAGTGAGVMAWLVFSGYRDWLKQKGDMAADREETTRMMEIIRHADREKK